MITTCVTHACDSCDSCLTAIVPNAAASKARVLSMRLVRGCLWGTGITQTRIGRCGHGALGHSCIPDVHLAGSSRMHAVTPHQCQLQLNVLSVQGVSVVGAWL